MWETLSVYHMTGKVLEIIIVITVCVSSYDRCLKVEKAQANE